MLCSYIDANTVRDEIRENVAISCPAVFNATSFRYNVNLTLTFPISQIILESINRFIIRTAVVDELNPMNPTGFLNDRVVITREVRLLHHKSVFKHSVT